MRISRDANLTTNFQLLPRINMNRNVPYLLLHDLMAWTKKVYPVYIWMVELLVFFLVRAENISSRPDEMASKM